MEARSLGSLSVALGLVGFATILYQLVLTRIFAIVLFADMAHLALALAMLGIGAGALIAHLLPSGPVDRRVGRMALGMAVSIVLVVLLATILPVFHFGPGENSWYDRHGDQLTLVRPWALALLLAVLAIPPVLAGAATALIFRARTDRFGALYAADLTGSALGALLFLPALTLWAGPDAALLASSAVLGAAALLLSGRGRVLSIAGLVLVLVAVVAGLFVDLLPVRVAAGWDQERVVHTEWTPVSRLSVYRGTLAGPGFQVPAEYIVVDNTSASLIPTDPRQLEYNDNFVLRSLVHRFHGKPGRVAILAAGAGPEVAMAQRYGHEHIDASDISAGMVGLIARRFGEGALLEESVRHFAMDGRAAVVAGGVSYDIIQLVYANFLSASGHLSRAWSPDGLVTMEAFGTYLDHVSDDGTIVITHAMGAALLPGIYAALEEAGARDPAQRVALVEQYDTTIFIKPRDWTPAERARLATLAQGYSGATIWDPPRKAGGRALTDDQPYFDSPRILMGKSPVSTPLRLLYISLAIQAGVLLLAGILFFGIPSLVHRRQLRGGLVPIVYVVGLGFGYLAVETVLVHQLVIFVAHPTYALTAVVFGMLLGSGLGSAVADRYRPALVPVLVLGVVAIALAAWVLPPVLLGGLSSAPVWLRVVVTAVCLLPVGFILGMPFPLGIAALGERAKPLVPWLWAINAWASTGAALLTTVVSRNLGFSVAMGVAIAAYGLALVAAARLRAVPVPAARVHE